MCGLGSMSQETEKDHRGGKEILHGRRKENKIDYIVVVFDRVKDR